MPAQPLARRTLLCAISLTQLCMTNTISRAILKLSDDGVVDIPSSAWAEIKQIGDEEFNAQISVHDHDAPGAFHGRPFVPFAHYLFEATLEEDVDIGDFIERIDPLIEALIESHTQQPVVPMAR